MPEDTDKTITPEMMARECQSASDAYEEAAKMVASDEFTSEGLVLALMQKAKGQAVASVAWRISLKDPKANA